MSHPNYCVVAAEILVLPLVFGMVWYGIVFSALNAAVLWIRIRAEATALGRDPETRIPSPDRTCLREAEGRRSGGTGFTRLASTSEARQARR